MERFLSDIIFYKKYFKEIDVKKIDSLLFCFLADKYGESLASRRGLILKEKHIAYFEGLHDGIDWSRFSDKDITYTKQEIKNLIDYIKKHKEVRIWSGISDEQMD